MSKKTLEFINYKREDLPTAYQIFMSELRHAPNKQCICFVEGETDTIFYKNVFHKKANLPRLEIYYQDCGNKKNVIKMYDKLKKSKCNYNKIIYFIVDHDYDGPPSIEDENFITIPYYCFENSFLLKENLHPVFNNFFDDDLVNIKLDNFINMYNKYVDYILLYSAYKKIIVSNPIISDKDNIKEKIMEFDIENNKLIFKYSYSKQDLKKLLSNSIFSISDKIIDENKDHLFNHQHLIDGKLLFLLLLKFLETELNMEIDKNELFKLSGAITFSFD